MDENHIRRENYTGTYKWDATLGKIVKISDRANVCVFDVFVPDGGYWSDNLQTFVESREHKRRILQERNLVENACGALSSKEV